MEIGIFGCDHAFGRGIDGPMTLYGLSDSIPDAISLIKEGYPAILSKLYPQHNFEVIPTLDGGNREIINSLVNCVQENPKDLYIVQTTQWHRATIGGLHYEKMLYSVTDNLAYNVYNPRSYHMKRYQDIHHCHYPNFNISKKPSQNLGRAPKGTYGPKYVWVPGQAKNGGFTPEHFKNARPFWDATEQVLTYDHISSFHHLHDIRASYNTLHYLSQKENIWYFFWYLPFGNPLDLFFYFKPDKELFVQEQGKLHAQFIKLKHEKLINKQSIHGYFNLDKNRIEQDDELHLPYEAHERVIDFLLSNAKFKAELDK